MNAHDIELDIARMQGRIEAMQQMLAQMAGKPQSAIPPPSPSFDDEADDLGMPGPLSLPGEDVRIPILKAWSKDLKLAASGLGSEEARFLVDYYYQSQQNRIRAGAQVRSGGHTEPNAVLQVLFDQQGTVETRIKQALDVYTKAHPVGAWLQSLVGIGPVIAAGLLAHVDITRCNTVGKLWSFAGLNPDATWEKGQKRPYNVRLKTLCVFKLGESFIKQAAHKDNLYAPLYYQRKQDEQRRNDTGENAEAAALKLKTMKYGKETEAYKWLSEGKFAPAHIHARCRRRMVKIFLAHYHECAYFQHFQALPPRPYVFSILRHADEIVPPHLHLIEGWAEARQKAGLQV